MAARFSGFPLGTLFEFVRQMRRSTMNDYLPRAGRPNSLGSWVLLTAVIEGLLANGQRQPAGRFYPLMVEALKRSGSLISVPESPDVRNGHRSGSQRREALAGRGAAF
jgi:hypothetical protein